MIEVDEIIQAVNSLGHITREDFKDIMLAEDEDHQEEETTLRSCSSMPALKGKSSHLYPNSKALFSKRVFPNQTSSDSPSETSRFNFLNLFKRLPFWRPKKSQNTIEVPPIKQDDGSLIRPASMFQSPTSKEPGFFLKTRKKSIVSQSVGGGLNTVTLPRNSIKVLREAFTVFDTDNDGFIDKKDMKGVMQRLGLSQIMTNKELDQLFRGVDLDRDGKINFNEFVELFFMK